LLSLAAAGVITVTAPADVTLATAFARSVGIVATATPPHTALTAVKPCKTGCDGRKVG
jgi:hypothetical protein